MVAKGISSMTKYIVFAEAELVGIEREFEIVEFDDAVPMAVVKDHLALVGMDLVSSISDSYWDEDSGYEYGDFANHWYEKFDPVKHAHYIESV